MFKPFRGRRPSAAIVISLVALFFALGGASYAAFTLPQGSVGTKQIRNNAVTYQKIEPGTVGSVRINQALVQTRVTGTCSGTTGAIGVVGQSGKVTCNPTAPKEFGSNSASTPVTATSTSITSKPLPGGTYLLTANPYVSVTTTVAPQDTTVTCTLSVPGGSTQAQTIQIRQGAAGTEEYSLPIDLASTVPAAGATAGLSCSQSSTATPASTATVISTLNAIQTSSNS